MFRVDVLDGPRRGADAALSLGLLIGCLDSM
jgi:hypothetical protein